MRTAQLLILTIGLLAAAAPKQTLVVTVRGGRLSGVPAKDPSIIVFKGIPYAAPPPKRSQTAP